jgi:hypothetical protein
LILEFVLKDDSQVQRLLATREEIFPEYHLEGLLAAFGNCFSLRQRAEITDSSRTLLLLERKA